MSSCCPPTPLRDHSARAQCPRSGSAGTRVPTLTVKALLTERALTRVGDGPYWFCPDATCALVYFDAAGGSFGTDEVRVPVWQKVPFGSRALCYCFGETEASIRAELETCGHSAASERIRGQIAAGRCACEIRNPRGVCCLGDVMAGIARVTAAVQGARDPGVIVEEGCVADGQ